ncbi:hypothetical protein RJ55_07320 [Drechmeria coniospora]|nr:hypothetical protein RJ55_07320 [Drechmeria coniospora]
MELSGSRPGGLSSDLFLYPDAPMYALGGSVPGARASLLAPTESSIGWALTALSLAVLLLYASHGRLVRLLPPWARPFAAEEAPPWGLKRRWWTHWTLVLALVALAGLVVAAVSACLRPRRPGAFVKLVPWLSVALITASGRPTSTPRILLLQYFLMLGAGFAAYAVRFLDHAVGALDAFELAGLGLCLAAVVAIGNMPLRDPSWDAEDIGNPHLPPSHHVRSPEDNLSLFRFWSMSWVFPLADAARRAELAVEDVWQLPLEFQHTRLYTAFGELRGRLIPRLVEANGLDLVVSTALAVVERVAEVTNIRLTSMLYAALDRGLTDEAYFWCLVMLSIDLLRQLSKTTSSWYSRKAYERSRGETFIGLFGKLLTRAVPGSDVTERGPAEDDVLPGNPPESRRRAAAGLLARCCGRRRSRPPVQPPHQPASNAKVVNLVRGDTYEISQRFWDFPKLVAQPVKVLFTLYFLVDIMGWPSTVGFALMAVFLTTNSLLVRETIKMERVRTAHSDKRAQAVSHFVEASRPLKLNGWTASWSRRIMRFRALEMRKRLQMARVAAVISTTNVLGGALYPLASICLYTLVLRRGLPNDVIWPSLQLFGQLEASVREAFSLASAYWKATIPIERVNRYMAEPDRDVSRPDARDEMRVEFRNASFSWPSTGHVVLRDVTLSLGEGLTVVRGEVGAGKSSLLLAALNEMELQGGELLRPDAPVGYAQQLPWLQNKTIRENILFHQPFDSSRYQEVVHACALATDLAGFPYGDQTKLEEGGVGLSGGQKARVSLARAAYSSCRILLLDDPLAPLDHDTATTIVRRFLRGPLAEGRVIVMVTHRDDLVLRIADQVVDMADGRASVLSKEQVELELAHPMHAPVAGPGDSEDATESAHEQLPEEEHVPGVKEAPEEAAETGSVPLSVYFGYMRAGGWHMWILLALFYGVSRCLDIARARLLEAWGGDTAYPATALGGYWGLPNPAVHPQVWLLVLGALSLGQVAAYAVAQLLLAKISVDAAQGLFEKAIERVSGATFRYYDVTPTGQLKNRLISDMGMVDGGILAPLESFVYSLIALTLSMVAITTHQPQLLLLVGAVALLYVHFFRYYVPVSRSLRRMEMRYLTPIIANIGVMQDGLVTIRALRVEGHFQDRHLEAVDDFQKQDHFFWSMAFWLDFRLSMSSASTRAAMILFMIWRGTPASAIGFVLTQTVIAMVSVQQLCEKFAQLQLDAVSLERVKALDRIPMEPTGDEDPPDDWPRPCDDIIFEGVSFRYADGLPDVLDEVTFEIPGRSTCAVLGRTGSGKSTVANALLATQTAHQGRVRIGGTDLATVSRTALRSRVTFIQQDPTLFPGTLRDNLDPEGKFSDDACLRVVGRVLGPIWRLDSAIDAGGKNLSQGERQLVGIGRAVLRRSGLVILDEATASIDRRTAALMQRILREELAESTVITIAHRLEAVEDATWRLRLERGKVVECGPAAGESASR